MQIKKMTVIALAAAVLMSGQALAEPASKKSHHEPAKQACHTKKERVKEHGKWVEKRVKVCR